MVQPIRGFRDILPGEVETWQEIEAVARPLLESFNLSEIRLPVLEKTALFARAIGQETDIVEKEMYTFTDRKGEQITMRPEATAGVVRSYIQHKLYAEDPVRKLFFIGPVFRRERPQKGRYRQFYQINAEVFGVASPFADVQLIYMLNALFSQLSVTDTILVMNSIGCLQCRPAHRKALSDALDRLSPELCADCRRRKEHNPLRVFDCKVPTCKAATSDAPSTLDHLCSDCSDHFSQVKTALGGLGIPFEVDSRLVRGLDYYTRTVFEMKTTRLGAQDAVAGGGRYDLLVEMLGGPPQPAVGFAIGFDRLVELVSAARNGSGPRPVLFIAPVGDRSRSLAVQWCCELADRGIRTEMDLDGRSLKSMMRRADRQGAVHVAIVGDRELGEGSVTLRDMSTKQQTSIPIPSLVDDLEKRLSVSVNP